MKYRFKFLIWKSGIWKTLRKSKFFKCYPENTIPHLTSRNVLQPKHRHNINMKYSRSEYKVENEKIWLLGLEEGWFHPPEYLYTYRCLKTWKLQNPNSFLSQLFWWRDTQPPWNQMVIITLWGSKFEEGRRKHSYRFQRQLLLRQWNFSRDLTNWESNWWQQIKAEK